MIKKIRVMLDYGCFPVWLYNENDELIDTLLPEELQNTELNVVFDDLQARYESLFVNNSKEFYFAGFSSKIEKEKFINDWNAAVKALIVALNGKYEIIDDSKIDLFEVKKKEQEMDKNICDKIIEEIKNLPAGAVFTVKEFLDKHNVDNSLYLRLSMTIIAGIREFVKMHEDDKGAFNGLPFVYRYIKK